MSFPTGRLRPAARPRDRDRRLRDLPVAFVPGAARSAGPEELDCADCPDEPAAGRAGRRRWPARRCVLGVLLYARAVRRRARRASALAAHAPLERLQLTPVYVCALLTFLLVTIAQAGAGPATRWWAAFIAAALLPFAFLGGLLRSHVSQLDAELRDAARGAARVARADRRRRVTPSAGGSSATCTTARSRGSSALAPAAAHGAARARGRRRARRRCSTARRRSCRRAWPSCASWPAASIRPCSPSAGSSRRCTRSRRARRCR